MSTPNIFQDECECKHDGKFYCTVIRVSNQNFRNGFACDKLCGYWMDFDPTFAGAIREEVPSRSDVGQENWRLFTMSYSLYPGGRTGGWKEGPRLSKGGKF